MKAPERSHWLYTDKLLNVVVNITYWSYIHTNLDAYSLLNHNINM